IATLLPSLQISPAVSNLAVGNSVTFSASGGIGAYTFRILSGDGTINASSGLYTAVGSSGSVTLSVEDEAGHNSEARITVTDAIQISPSPITLAANNSISFSAMGGVGTYSYSVVSGGGSIHPVSGVYTAPPISGSATVRVVDSLGNISNSLVTI